MVVQVFPFDHRLPALRRLAPGPTPALAALLTAAAGAPAGTAQRWTSEPVRYRPQRCAVLRHTLHAGRSAERFYVKFHAKDADLEAARRAAALAGSAAGFAVPRPLLELTESRVVVTTEVPGTPFHRVIARGQGIEDAARAVASALVTFHRDTEPPARAFTVADELAELERAAALVRWARPDLHRTVTRLGARVEGDLCDVPACATHQDLKPDHILLGGVRPALIDLDTCAAADPAIDAGKLLARLFGLPYEHAVTRARADRAMRAFAGAYLGAVPPAWRTRLDAHYAVALLKLAASVLRRQVPGWPEVVGALVAEADRALPRRSPRSAAR
jgi:hypothetical protein